MKKSTLVKLSALVLSLGLLSGCASTEQLKQMQADIAKAQQTADAALAAAKDADRKAGAAMKAANAAQAAADECAERCDRMMNKAMAK
ncbi:MAG: Lpp/OprI family alanine-zipper lipoprotein [Chromatiales bacterium]|nr:Lpp/OprI family alanine-zipper lipoprotein [Chromatiales bacterium]